jgi:hypothetical protein
MIRFFAALLLATGFAMAAAPASQGATISIKSMQYSQSRPVPHIHYEGGTAAGDLDLLRSIFQNFVHCGIECATPEGRPTAVLTMFGEGGDYHEGLRLADFLRANNIATVVESGAYCYSACAFTFLGGTSYSTNRTIGQYVDRTIEPGAKVGFHAPYRDEAAIRQALLDRTPGDLLHESRGALSLMVKELVKWNVDPEIIHHMVDQGPDAFYMVDTPQAYYLTRTALPEVPSSGWMTDIPSAIRNACIRLLAWFERTDPAELDGRIATPYEPGIGLGEDGKPVSGYRLSNESLEVGFCAATDASIATGTDFDISLYLNPLQPGGNSLTVLSFFNRDGGFSTSDIGASPLRRIFQRGGMGHWFLPVGLNMETADFPGPRLLTRADRFFSIQPAQLPPPRPGFTVDVPGERTRVSHSGNVWLFEQVGSGELFDTALAASGDGVFLTHDSVLQDAFVRDGVHADGTFFSLTGLRGATSSLVQRVVILNGAQPLSDADRALLGEVNCGASHEGVRLIC